MKERAYRAFILVNEIEVFSLAGRSDILYVLTFP